MRQPVDSDATLLGELTKDASVAPGIVGPAPSTNGSGVEKAPKTLKQLATHGSLWTIAGYGCSQVLRFGANVVLARLLFPEAFGLMAIVNDTLQGLVMFSDVGIYQSIIRHPRRDDAEFYNTAWTVQAIRGFVLMLIALGLAWPLGQMYDPFLTRLIAAVAVTSLITGFTSTKLATANRDLLLARMTLIDLTAQVLSIGVMVGFAWYRHSVWALVIGAFASAILRLVLSHVAFPGTANRFCWRPEAARELFRFGRWIFVRTMFPFLALRTDKLILGQLLILQNGSIEALKLLGIYSVAFAMTSTVSGIFEQLANRVLMPAMCHVSKSSLSRYADVLLRSRQFILMAAAVAVADLILLAPTVFACLYDPRWQAGAWMTQMLGCGLWFTLLQRTSEASLVATGHSRVMAVANGTNFFVTVVAAPLGYYFFGIAGFIGGWTLGNFAAVVVMDWELVRSGIGVAKQDLQMSLFVAALTLAGFALQHFSQHHVEGRTLLVIGDVAAAAVISIVGAIAIFVRNRHFAFVKASAV